MDYVRRLLVVKLLDTITEIVENPMQETSWKEIKQYIVEVAQERNAHETALAEFLAWWD